MLTIVENTLPRPRDYRSPDFLAMVDRLHEAITGSALPDLPPTTPRPGLSTCEPLPRAYAGEIIGP